MNGRQPLNPRKNSPPTRRTSTLTPAQPPRRAPRRKKRTSPLRKLIGLGALISVVAGGIWAGKMVGGVVGTNNVGTWWNIYNNPQKFFPQKERMSVLLIGKDYEYDKNYVRYTGKSSRADSIMLLSLDFKNRHVSALSIPRDTRVQVAGKTGKINATIREDTYPGIAGPQLLCDAVEDVTGVKPDYYLAVKPDAVGNLVKELGGVDVETLDVIEYNDFKAGLHVKLPKGNVRITTPEEAIGYCRYREIDRYVRNPDGSGVYIGKSASGVPLFKQKPSAELAELNKCLENGDTRRMARQQNMIRAMISSGKKQFYRADKIVKTAFRQFDTNLKHEQLLAIASLYRNVQAENMAAATLMGDFEKRKPYFFIPDHRKTEALVQWLVYGNEKAANRVTSVAVENATDVSGAARRAAELLRDRGEFDADYVMTSPKTAAATTTIYFTKAANKPRADAIAALLGGGTVQKDLGPDMTGTLSEIKPDVRVVLGQDLASTLGEQAAHR